MAQGTEIAVQPIGVGLTITAGEILDPVNDLVERFSWLALVASASLGTQLLLTEIATETTISIVFSIIVGAALIALWWPKTFPGRSWLLRFAVIALFGRFLFTVVGLTVGLVDSWALESRQQAALSGLSDTSEQIAALESEPIQVLPEEPSWSERLDNLLDDGRDLLDLEARLDTLQQRAESAIDHLLTLTVLFFVQTLLVPIGAFWVGVAVFKGLWRWLRQPIA